MATLLEKLIVCDGFDLEVCGGALRRHPHLLGTVGDRPARVSRRESETNARGSLASRSTLP